MENTKKLEEELNIFELAKPLLKELYGSFDKVTDQLDKPDAAIILKQNNKKIGIEITSVDKQSALQYFNDKKITKETELKQLDDLLKDGSYSSQPTKKMSISFPHNYIFDGVFKKKDKHSGYTKSSDYDEIIILAFSSYLDFGYEHFDGYHKPWTEFLLSEKDFPFNKVIYVCKTTSKAVVIYNQDSPQLIKPKIDKDKELGKTHIQGPILPAGKTVNIRKIYNNSPLIKPIQSRNKAIKERKAKRKAQRKARKVNSKKA